MKTIYRPTRLPKPTWNDRALLPTVPVADVLDNLQSRLAEEFDRAEAQVRSKQIADTRTVANRHKRLQDLTGAINTINRYANEEYGSSLHLTQSGYVSSIALDDPRF